MEQKLGFIRMEEQDKQLHHKKRKVKENNNRKNEEETKGNETLYNTLDDKVIYDPSVPPIKPETMTELEQLSKPITYDLMLSDDNDDDDDDDDGDDDDDDGDDDSN